MTRWQNCGPARSDASVYFIMYLSVQASRGVIASLTLHMRLLCCSLNPEDRRQLSRARRDNLAGSAFVDGAALGFVDRKEQCDTATVRVEDRLAQVKETAVKGPVGLESMLALAGTELFPVPTCGLQV